MKFITVMYQVLQESDSSLRALHELSYIYGTNDQTYKEDFTWRQHI